VSINAHSTLIGGVAADRLIINGNGLLAQPGVAKPGSDDDNQDNHDH
jgi:hypothetical protein